MTKFNVINVNVINVNLYVLQLLSVIPAENSLALVYRDSQTLRFVKHLNHRCLSNQSNPSFYDLSVVYHEQRGRVNIVLSGHRHGRILDFGKGGRSFKDDLQPKNKGGGIIFNMKRRSGHNFAIVYISKQCNDKKPCKIFTKKQSLVPKMPNCLSKYNVDRITCLLSYMSIITDSFGI